MEGPKKMGDGSEKRVKTPGDIEEAKFGLQQAVAQRGMTDFSAWGEFVKDLDQLCALAGKLGNDDERASHVVEVQRLAELLEVKVAADPRFNERAPKYVAEFTEWLAHRIESSSMVVASLNPTVLDQKPRDSGRRPLT